MSAFVDNDASPRACASKLFVCVTCRLTGEPADDQQARPGARLLKILSQIVEAGGQDPEKAIGQDPEKDIEQDIGQDIEIVPIECLSNCTRGCTVAVSGPGKWTYVIGALDPEQHAEDVIRFARLHHAHAEGLPVWRERPLHIRKNTIARVPPLAVQRQQIGENTR